MYELPHGAAQPDSEASPRHPCGGHGVRSSPAVL